ncbi:O-antigen translocase [Pseudomonas sp. GM48]|uniref:O-antigen translocase n=1 Tax=Pseudomonas sp. GM48 TaxID=1144330 RepID=UPI00026FEE5C|nr:O-antigen translocase [Pseudomonas sp. GM48]EJM58673.1 membrane protein involved in the export of O-antigen and teichoic acid [Pseudomonas sp. GM48]
MARLKAGIHFASSILVKAVAGLIVIKLLAWKLGPDGFGLLGQLMTLVAITGMFAGGGITNGLIKVLAESPVASKEGKAWFATAFTLTTVISAIVALFLMLFSSALSSRLMQGGFTALFVGLGLVQAIVGYASLVQAEASSRGESVFYAKVNILGTVLGTLVLALAVNSFGFDGAAYSVMLMPALTAIVTLLFMASGRRELFHFSRFLVDRVRMRHLLSFSVLALVGSTSVPVAQILMRDGMAQKFGWEQVGLWQGVIKLSDVYMQFVGVVLMNYVLPRYASAANLNLVIKEFKISLLWLLSALMLGFIALYSLKNIVVRLVFSNEFLPMTDYFLPQMVGDVFRTIASAISLIFMARGAVRVSIIFEFAQGIFIFSVFLMLLSTFGSMAPVYAHVITYGLLSIFMAVGLGFWFKRGKS